MKISKEGEKVWTELEYAYAQAMGEEIPEKVKEKFGDSSTETTEEGGASSE
ncbi:hypothetical protein [Natrinema altunense]|uniref:hypothetical protein n=1 Tax=Natrinema altunense TaxID=222984 RepID=UPI00135F11ED|nr:hypothetical protein [Natrinema altunense]